MKNILIITAHPSSKGHTHIIANTYKDASEAKGYKVEILDLYREENFLPYLKFEDIKSYEKHPNVLRFQEMITNSNEVVFIHPLWWGGTPAIMKNFLDQVITAGFAFSWAGGKLNKLLGGRSSKVFITCGGSMLLYRLFIFPPFWAIWKFFTIEYCGMKLVDFLVCDKMAIRDGFEERWNKFLEKVRTSSNK